MNAKKFSDAMSELDNKYIDEALNYKKKAKKPFWIKWGVIAACLCLIVPLTAFAIDTIQYNAAVDYLNSLGIPVEDLSDYSRKEIKEAAKTIDAGESSPLTEEILNRLPDNKEPIETPTQVTSEQIRELTPTMTREEVLSFLGDTQDIGSGIYVYVYEVDGEYLLRIPFASDDAQLGVTGEDLLKALTPISGDIGSNGTIEFNGQSFSKSDLTEETLEWLEWYNSLSPEEQLAVSSIPADLYTNDGAGSTIADAPPMVCVNDTLYKQSTKQTSYNELKDDFVYLGVIESDITNLQNNSSGNASDGIPKENFQANHPIVGAKVYQYGDDIVVEIEGKYWLYETINDNTLDEQSELSEEEKMQLDPFYGAGIDGNPD